MRKVNSLSDVQIVLNDLLDWRSRFETSDWDRHMFKVINAAPATNPNDYVILSQLPKIPAPQGQKGQHYTQVFSNGGIVTIGQAIPPFVVGDNRVGDPIQAWLAATGPPSGGPLSINIQLNGTNILPIDLTLPNGQQGPVITSTFVSPIPFVKYLALVIPTITAANGASAVSIGLVVQRTK